MSDATLPPPRSSSAAPATERGLRSDSSSGEGEYDTRFDQSSGHIIRDAGSGDSEGRAEGKQKRKRTCPGDQAVLESEYKQNPKPNKAARAEIVEKISLNEKEVQIWFQNRRQINRRKSRPLLPHEIAAFGLGGMASLSSDPAPIISLESSQTIGEPSFQQSTIDSQDEEPRSDLAEFTLVEEADERVGFKENELVEPVVGNNMSSFPLDKASLKHQSSRVFNAENSSFSDPDFLFKSFTSSPGYLANRLNPTSSSFSTPSSSQADAFTTPTISQPKQPASCPRRVSNPSTPTSRVRLSMSLDGKAELVTASPSPPRKFPARPSSSSGSVVPHKRMRILQRSKSDMPFGSWSLNSPHIPPFAPGLPSGRSRDARSWEFCCDTDARDELTTQAERESNGSAVAAISLLRSTSSSVLRPNKNKRNAPPAKHDSSKQGKKQKFGGADSSITRLQDPGKAKQSSYGKDGLMLSPSGDSDKENWLPGENTGNSRRRPLPSTRSHKPSSSKSVLGDNLNVPTQAVGFGGSKNRKRKGRGANAGSKIFEDEETSEEVGEEVEKFMRGEVSPSKKGDLDCIQGLLSLSQGNWK